MRRLLLLLAISASGLFASAPAFAQTAGAQVLPNGCGTAGYAGKTNMQPLTQDTNGNLCGSGSGGGGTGQGVYVLPQSAAAAGITSVVSTSAESGHIFKASAGNFYGSFVTTGATPGYLLIFDSATVPSNGAVTPKLCVVAPANATTGVTYNSGPPGVFATGISAAFSTTGCFTLTLSSTAFFNGRVQ